MSIIERCKLLFLSEPKKSFLKAEITYFDGFLTEEGKNIFLTWLFEKNAEEFKKEIVDLLLVEMEKEKNK